MTVHTLVAMDIAGRSRQQHRWYEHRMTVHKLALAPPVCDDGGAARRPGGSWRRRRWAPVELLRFSAGAGRRPPQGAGATFLIFPEESGAGSAARWSSGVCDAGKCVTVGVRIWGRRACYQIYPGGTAGLSVQARLDLEPLADVGEQRDLVGLPLAGQCREVGE